MRNSLFSDIFSDFLSLVYPRYCVGCQGSLVKGEAVICTSCLLEMPQTNHHLYRDNSLRNRIASRLEVDFVMALFRFTKNGRVQHLLHSLKYENRPEIGVRLGKFYGEKLLEKSYHRQFDAIIPVPLHPLRMQRRGYNQSEKFAQGLAEMLHLPATDYCMIRKHKTDTQTRKTKLSRWQNVSEVFGVTNPAFVSGKRILLVDDVITTGATLEACGTALLQAGCRAISIACIAEA